MTTFTCPIRRYAKKIMEYLVLVVVTALVVIVVSFHLQKRKRRLRRGHVVYYRVGTNESCGEDQVGTTKALVTGGCGCLGTEIVSKLIADGRYIVHSLDLHIPPEHKRILGVTSYIQTDITRKDDISRALEGIEVVFHTAALLPFSIRNTHQAMRQVNVEGTRNVVEACKTNGVKRLVYTSSCSVTMNRSRNHSKSEEIVESVPLPQNPLNAYVETKGAAEMLVRKANGVGGLRTCAIRLSGLMGGRNNPAMPEFVATRMRRLGEGNYPMAWTTLKAATNVHLIADQYLTKKPISSERNTFNVVSANIIYRDIISFCAQQNGGKDPLVIPMWVGRLMANINEYVLRLTGYIPFDERVNLISLDYFCSCVYSAKHTERELGWVERRPWQDILKEVLKEYKTELCMDIT